MNAPVDKESKAHSDLLIRVLFLVLGAVFLVLAVIGFLLPMVPGMIFLILAAGCFARSSDRCHSWLLNSAWFGPAIRNWQTHRAMSVRNKVIAITCTIMFGGYSVFFLIEQIWLQWVAVAFLASCVAIIVSVKTRVECSG